MDKIVLQIRLMKIKEVSYSSRFTGQFKDGLTPSDIHIGLTLALRPDLAQEQLELIVGVRYYAIPACVPCDLLTYKISMRYSIAGLADYVEMKGNTSAIKPELLAMLVGWGIGSLRGMLALRTCETILDDYPLPVIPLGPLITAMQNDPLQDMALSPLFQFQLS